MAIKTNSLILIVLVTILWGCNKEDFKWNLPRENSYDGQIIDTSGYNVPNKDAPKVTTGSVSNISESTSTVSGDIKSVGSSKVSSYGHCWSINPMPTITDTSTKLGSTSSVGIFSSNLTGLSPNTTYYARSYASNSFGTSYGNQVSFKTKALLCGYYNCESLTDFTTYVDKISPSSSSAWVIGSGYNGSSFNLIESCYGGYIEFSKNLSNTAKITFWTKSINPGYSNRTPEVTVDGVISNTTIIDGSSSYNNWMQLETQNILPGTHTIRINYTHISTYYSYYIDEIKIWCQ
jgi:hypothetical protein